ncbi:MAG: hypothetical protein ABSG56_36625 [Bryobacteraceae bacterium]|jgi:hypothetical protein
MSRARIWLAVLLAAPITVVAIGSTAYILAGLMSPCVVWRGSDSGGAYASAHHPCTDLEGLGETMRGVLVLAAVQGVIILAAVLGIWGTVRSRQWMVVLAGCLMILEVFPLVFSFFPLALLAGIGFFWTAYHMPA